MKRFLPFLYLRIYSNVACDLEILKFEHLKQIQLNILLTPSLNAKLNTGSANSVCPKCPGQFFSLSPHVKQVR